LYLLRIDVDIQTNTTPWIENTLQIDENLLLSQVAALLASFNSISPKDSDLLWSQLYDASDEKSSFKASSTIANVDELSSAGLGTGVNTIDRNALDMILLSAAGGWFPIITEGSVVTFAPRKGGLYHNHRSYLDQSVFLTKAVVTTEDVNGNGMTQVLLKQTVGCYEIVRNYKKSAGSATLLQPSHPVFIPSTAKYSMFGSTEVALTQDLSPILPLNQFYLDYFANYFFKAAAGSSNTNTNLLDLLKFILNYTKM
jgi:hypothetical protein